MKSTMLTNWIAPTRKTIRRSDVGTGSVARPALVTVSPFSRALAQGAELFECRAAQVRVRSDLVPDRRRRRLPVVVPGVDARLFGEAREPLQALPHLRRIAALKIGAAAPAHEHHVARDDV